jgi:hypothetical protein
MSFLQNLLVKVRRHGLPATLHSLALQAVNCLVPFRILRGVYVDQAAPEYLACPQPLNPSFLSAGALQAYAEDPATEISRQFLANALGSGDECYAICDGAKLAAYGWYSTRPTPIGLPDLLLHFAPGYVYMYKGFTDSRYRGKRLHAIGMTRALEHYLGKGYGGIVSYVESDNFDSLKSCFRMGYRVFGSVFLIRVFGRYFAFATPGCKPFGFRVARAARDKRQDPSFAKGS